MERQGSVDRLVILCKPFGKAFEFRNVGLVGGGDPGVEFRCATFTDKALKCLGQVAGSSDGDIRLAERIQQLLVFRCQAFLGLTQQPGRLARTQWFYERTQRCGFDACCQLRQMLVRAPYNMLTALEAQGSEFLMQAGNRCTPFLPAAPQVIQIG